MAQPSRAVESRGDTMPAFCRRYGLDLVAAHEGADRSALVAHVRDRTGHDLVLKRTSPERGRGELDALRAWSDTGLASRLIAVLEPNLYLAEWLHGPSLAEAASREPVDVRAIGRMLHGLHAVSPPSGLRPVRDRFTVAAHEGWGRLLPALRDLGVAVTAHLTSYVAPREILLHGDLVPLNILLTPDGPKIIDPIGYRGFQAWDLAQLAVAVEGRGGGRMLPDLLDGYGGAPPLMAQVFAWMILFFLQKKPDRGSPRVRRQPTASRGGFTHRRRPRRVSPSILRRVGGFMRADRLLSIMLLLQARGCLTALVLRFGAGVEVVEPTELRQRIIGLARSIADFYART